MNQCTLRAVQLIDRTVYLYNCAKTTSKQDNVFSGEKGSQDYAEVQMRTPGSEPGQVPMSQARAHLKAADFLDQYGLNPNAAMKMDRLDFYLDTVLGGVLATVYPDVSYRPIVRKKSAGLRADNFIALRSAHQDRIIGDTSLAFDQLVYNARNEGAKWGGDFLNAYEFSAQWCFSQATELCTHSSIDLLAKLFNPEEAFERAGALQLSAEEMLKQFTDRAYMESNWGQVAGVMEEVAKRHEVAQALSMEIILPETTMQLIFQVNQLKSEVEADRARNSHLSTGGTGFMLR